MSCSLSRDAATRSTSRHNGSLAAALIAGLLLSVTGSGCYCITRVDDTVPAHRLDKHFLSCPKDNLVPVPMTALGQPKPDDHLIGAGDQLAVYVYGVLPASTDETLVLQRTQPVNQRYYPPNGSVVGPVTGVPTTVAADGTLPLPIIGDVDVDGLTTSEATKKLKELYAEEGVVNKGRERISVQLITPRVRRIVVMREDTPSPNVELLPPGQVDHIHRGSGETIDLPIYENDVMHALAQTGGLPGTDAPNEIWVFRQKGSIQQAGFTEPMAGTMIADAMAGRENGAIRIPLKGPLGAPLPFSTKDVILGEGDVVYVPRYQEHFLVGGFLPGARIPLPRDEDIDILDAIALATGSTGGPLASSGLVLANGRPGHVVKPTRAVVVRELPDGRTIRIRVDLGRAVRDPKERIVIQPNDLVMVQAKPYQAIANTVLNLFNLSITTLTEQN